ncbi:MAG TPA: hypothetical protein VN796_07560 [Acidimicrobiales bacterium]|nr:hypothetical protein [Acidimicrobiales bacterium]
MRCAREESRWRRELAVKRATVVDRVTLGLVLAATAMTVAACSGGTPGGTPVPRTTSSTSATSPSETSTSAPAATSTTAAAPSGGPVPSGFDAVAYTAVSAEEFWLLGTAPCSAPVCTSIIRTTDGGAHFVGIPAPPAPLAYGTSATAPGVIDTLRFADPFDGYAVGVRPSGTTSGLWVTHDGGEHWSAQVLGDVEAFDISDGEVYVVVGDCTDTGCRDVHLERSAAHSSSWTATPLPGVQSSPEASVSAHDGQVWIDAESGTGDLLEHSSDGGASFTSGRSPCNAGLGGTVQAATDRVLWFMCPTGMMASAQRSTDAGATFEDLGTGEIVNSSEIAAADATTAVVVDGDSPALRRTADGGGTFRTVFSAPGATGWLYVGFTTPAVGVGLSTGPGSGTRTVPATTLWRTVDAGITWNRVSY